MDNITTEERSMADSTEHYYAEMESARNASMDDYFKARPQLFRTIEQETIFRAGFERAFAMLWNSRVITGSDHD